MNKYSLPLFILCLWGSVQLLGQSTQWASEVINVSSQYETDYYSAHQALGVPNALANESLTYMAWAPKSEDSNFGEHIHVGFSSAMRIQQIAVVESLNPGSIVRIWAYDKDGKRHKLYENKSPKPIKDLRNARIFRHKLDELTEYYVEQLKVELHTGMVPGRNQIDAIAISDDTKDIRPSVSVLRYAEEVAAPEKLGKTVNSSFPERLPIIAPNGKTLFFARKNHPKNTGADNKDDIWVAYRQDDDTWSTATNIGAPLNNDDHNFVAATNAMGTTLFLGNNYEKKEQGLSVAQKKGDSWQSPKAADIEDFSNESPFVGYHLNVDGDIMLMSVQREEGIGERDFYVSFKKKDQTWTKPKNLGSSINTVNTENSIFLAADNRTIYFSSNGHHGYGGFDMFMSRRLDNTWTKWTKPKNLGKKINSNQNDFNYTIPASGEYAYFASGSMQNSDLYRIKLPKEIQPKPVALLKTRIVDAETGEVVDGDLNIHPLGKKYERKEASEGESEWVLPFGNHIGVHVEKDGYFSTSSNIELGKEQLVELDGTGPQADDVALASDSKLDQLKSEIEALKAKLNESEKARQKQVSTSTLPPLNAPVAASETQASKPKPSSSSKPKTEYANMGDPELDALQQKFNSHFEEGEQSNTSKPSEQTDQTENPMAATPSKPTKEEDSELEAMKKRFNQHFEEKDEPTEAPKADKPVIADSKPPTKIQADEEEIRQVLLAELRPRIKMDLQEELFSNVANEVADELNTELKPQTEKKIKKQLQKNINKETTLLETGLPDVELPDDIDSLRKTLSADLQKQLRPEVETELRREIRYALYADQKVQLQHEIEQEREAQKAEDAKPKPNSEVEEEPEWSAKPSYREVEKEMLLVQIKVGQVIPMNNIFFDANLSTLKDASFNELDRVVSFLRKNKNLVVEVGGHTNSWCSSEFAHELSKDRAEVVMNYFIKEGVPANRIQHRGYGKSKPIADNKTKAGRRKNQRVELIILKVK